jgi:hypothetical protein
MNKEMTQNDTLFSGKATQPLSERVFNSDNLPIILPNATIEHTA